LCVVTHTQQDAPGRVSDRPRGLYLYDIQHSQERNSHAPGGFRTRNPSKRAIADPHHRPRGNWDRLYCLPVRIIDQCLLSETVPK
jgi:hypothetical protein